MLVVAVVPRHRVVVVVVDVRAGLVIVVERQVGMVRLDTVVQDGHDDALAGVALLPGRTEVHVVAVLGAAVLRQSGMPNFFMTNLLLYHPNTHAALSFIPEDTQGVI